MGFKAEFSSHVRGEEPQSLKLIKRIPEFFIFFHIYCRVLVFSCITGPNNNCDIDEAVSVVGALLLRLKAVIVETRPD